METTWRETANSFAENLRFSSFSMVEDRLASLLSGTDFSLTGIPDDFEAVEDLMKALLPTAELTLSYRPSAAAWTAILVDEEGGFASQASATSAPLSILGAIVFAMADLEDRDALAGNAAA